jgi:hypothetical protein
VSVRTLDHVFALHQAAVHSGKPEIEQQIGAFQHACRDIARRVGLTPFEAQPGEAFDEKRHKSVDESTAPPDDAHVKETLGPGIAFQGKLVRPALVLLESAAPAPVPETPPVVEAPPPVELAEVETPQTSEPQAAEAAAGPVPAPAASSEPSPVEPAPPAEEPQQSLL